MALTFPTKVVTVTQIGDQPATWETVRLLGVHLPAGAQPGQCQLEFPEAYALTDLPALGEEVEVALDDVTIFKGVVISYPGEIGPQAEGQVAILADPRWELQRMRVGQKDIGPREGGGFEEVGMLVAFNPGGRRNRSATASGGVYQFDSSANAEFWTRKQILEWLAHWYMDTTVEVDASALTGAWDEEEFDFVPYLQTVPEALTRLCRSAGASWGIYFEDGQAYFVPIQAGGIGTLALALPAAESAGNLASTATELHVLSLAAAPSIERSIDTVEMHTAPRWIEHTYGNTLEGEVQPLLESFTPKDTRYFYGWKAVTNRYAQHLLGQDLAYGARPKRWLRHNGTTVDATGLAYYAALADGLKCGLGRAMRPEECFWVGVVDPDTQVETKYRVRAGFTILTERAQLLIEAVLELEDGTTLSFPDAEDWDDVRIYLTVTTEVEEPDTLQYGNSEANYHMEGKPIVQTVYRSDMRPVYRYKARLPKLADLATDPNASEVLGDGTALESYLEWTGEMIEAAQRIAAALTPAESRGRIRLLGIPTEARLGQLVTISPDQGGLAGTEVIVDLLYQTAEGDHLELTVDRNLARLLG